MPDEQKKLALLFPEGNSKLRIVIEAAAVKGGYKVEIYENFTALSMSSALDWDVVMFVWSTAKAEELAAFVNILSAGGEEERKTKIYAFDANWEDMKLRMTARKNGCDDLLSVPPVTEQLAKALDIVIEVKPPERLAAQPAPQIKKDAPAAAKPPEGEKLVLIVDDAAVIRRTIKMVVEEMGYPVAEAENGNFAYEKASASLPKLVITDLSMPVMDGFGLIARMRSTPKMSQIPIIVISGYGDKPNIINALKSGATDFVVKPFQGEVLKSKIQRHIER